jgi:anti-sigma B factor antagonist
VEIKIRQDGAVAVAVVSGEIDSKTAGAAQAELMPLIETSRKTVLDLTQVTFMSSAGLRMLLLLYRQATAREGQVALLGLSDEIRDTMSMTGFLTFFRVADTLEAAKSALA